MKPTPLRALIFLLVLCFMVFTTQSLRKTKEPRVEAQTVTQTEALRNSVLFSRSMSRWGTLGRHKVSTTTLTKEEPQHQEDHALRNHSDSSFNIYTLQARIVQAQKESPTKLKQLLKQTNPRRLSSSTSFPPTSPRAPSELQHLPPMFDGELFQTALDRQSDQQNHLYLFDACSGQVLRSVLDACRSVLGSNAQIEYANLETSTKKQQTEVLVNHVYLDNDFQKDYRVTAATIGPPIQLRYAQFQRMLQTTSELKPNEFHQWVARQPDNFLVRRFCGLSCKQVPRGQLNRSHYHLAIDHLDQFDVVIDQGILGDGIVVLLRLLDSAAHATAWSLDNLNNTLDHQLPKMELMIDTEQFYTWDLLFYEHAAVRAHLIVQELAMLTRGQMQLNCQDPSPCGCGRCSLF